MNNEIEKILKANRGGSKLLTVKTQRNQLAHGNISFSECGRDHTFIELNNIKNEVINYLEDILNNIENYIDNKAYKKT
ncbi:MAG: MAE_28990/MAE_18760 family HEPN-like nuclease [Pseudomonadota bacterium]|nr:MAE_28990/MAE_18760 family HEPN-like nuclease [Pseudomonadota bacterium]